MARQKLAFVRDSKKKDRSHAKRGKAFSLLSTTEEDHATAGSVIL